MLGLRGGCNYFSVSIGNQMQKQVTQLAQLSTPRRSNGRTAEFLVKLETENTELRHQAVELALQIQKLVESQFR